MANKKPPLKPEPGFDNAGDNAFRATTEELRGIVERLEKLDEDKGHVADLIKEETASAKSRGYDPKAIKQIIRERKADKTKLDEHQAVMDLYRDVLGM